MKQKIALILFDLGGVLLQLQGVDYIRKAFPDAVDDAEAHQRWIQLQCIHGIETGKIDLAEFLATASQELNLDLGPDEFYELHRSWVVGEHPGATDLLKALKGNHRIACLSNTNVSHMDKIREQGTLLDQFAALYLSYEMGVMKPDLKIYKQVIAAEGIAAETILFLDDNAKNIAAAQKCGITAEQVNGLAEVKACLQRYNLF